MAKKFHYKRQKAEIFSGLIVQLAFIKNSKSKNNYH